MVNQLVGLVIVLPGENFVTVGTLECGFQMYTFNMPDKVISCCKRFDTFVAFKWRYFIIILDEIVEELVNSVISGNHVRATI